MTTRIPRGRAVALATLVAVACADPSSPRPATLGLQLAVDSAVLGELDTVRLVASMATDTTGTTRDPMRPVWVSTDTSVAIVDSTGLVRARGPGLATIAVLAEGRTAQAAVRVGLEFAALADPLGDECALSASRRAWCWLPDTVPALVSSSLRFRDLSASAGVRCGIAVDSTGWCWGENYTGAVGNGTLSPVPEPTPVQGGHKWIELRVGARGYGAAMTCGITTQSETWCWGHNAYGGLGNGSTVPNSPTPVLVQGGHQFTSVVPGEGGACALKANGEAWCWGANNEGQLGLGSRDSLRRTPGLVPVPAGMRFVQLAASVASFCALTDDGRVLCWGSNLYLGLGRPGPACDPDNYVYACVAGPDTVSGGRRYGQLTAGSYMTCALDLNGRAYCWGTDMHGFGMFGAALVNQSAVPMPAMGSLGFESLSLGELATCGRATGGQVLCAGYRYGRVPRPVARQR